MRRNNNGYTITSTFPSCHVFVGIQVQKIMQEVIRNQHSLNRVGGSSYRLVRPILYNTAKSNHCAFTLVIINNTLAKELRNRSLGTRSGHS